VILALGYAHEAARVHHATRRRSGSVAACGTRAAGRDAVILRYEMRSRMMTPGAKFSHTPSILVLMSLANQWEKRAGL
jgi:hypothetical protein